MPSDSSKRKLLKDFFTVIPYSLWHWNMRVIFFKSLFIFFFFQFCLLFSIFFCFSSYCVLLLFFPLFSVFEFLSFFCVISVPFPSDSVLLRCLFFLVILIRRLFCPLPGLTASHCGGSSICVPLRDRLLNIWRLNLYHIEWFSTHLTGNRSFLLEKDYHTKCINKFCEQNA